MLVAFYVLAAALLVWSRYVAPLPQSVLNVSTWIAWFGAAMAVFANLALLFAAATARITPPQLLRDTVQEEEQASVLRWWQFPFATLLIAVEWNLLSAIAAVSAGLNYPISVMSLRAAKRRLAACDASVAEVAEGIKE